MIRLVVQGLPVLVEVWRTHKGMELEAERAEAVKTIPVGRNHILPELRRCYGDGEKRLLPDLLRRKDIETDA